jgi:hypothetical protein
MHPVMHKPSSHSLHTTNSPPPPQELHIIIFDEIDAICKQRGTVRDGTATHDTIVNQLLTKIDGVDALNNILLIGMTNRSGGAPVAAGVLFSTAGPAAKPLGCGPRSPANHLPAKTCACARLHPRPTTQSKCLNARPPPPNTHTGPQPLEPFPHTPHPTPPPPTLPGVTCWTRPCCAPAAWRSRSR